MAFKQSIQHPSPPISYILLWILAILCVVASLFALLLKTPRCGEGVSTDAQFSSAEIVEVETFGEKHDYLLFKRVYTRGITHVPNCRHCKGDSTK